MRVCSPALGAHLPQGLFLSQNLFFCLHARHDRCPFRSDGCAPSSECTSSASEPSPLPSGPSIMVSAAIIMVMSQSAEKSGRGSIEISSFGPPTFTFS